MQEQIHALTGLRGVLCLWVWILHVAMFLWHMARIGLNEIVGSHLSHIAMHGYVAVDCFFILSGFVLSHRYRHETQLLCRDFLWRFWRARIARIYPLYVIVLLLMGLVVYWGSVPQTVRGFPPASDHLPAYDPLSGMAFLKNIFLVQSWDWFPRLSWNMAAWSISSEWAMYVLCPLILLCVRRIHAPRAAIMAAIILQALLIGLLYILAIPAQYHAATFQEVTELEVHQYSNMQRTSLMAVELGVLRAFCGFCGGCLMYRVYRHPEFKEKHIHRLGLPSLLFMLGILIWAPVNCVYPWLLLLVLLLSDERFFLTRLLQTRPALAVGNASYAIYILHIPLIGGLMAIPDISMHLQNAGAIQLLLYLIILTAMLIGVSMAVYRWIELPLRNLIRAKPPELSAT